MKLSKEDYNLVVNNLKILNRVVKNRLELDHDWGNVPTYLIKLEDEKYKLAVGFSQEVFHIILERDRFFSNFLMSATFTFVPENHVINIECKKTKGVTVKHYLTLILKSLNHDYSNEEGDILEILKGFTCD